MSDFIFTKAMAEEIAESINGRETVGDWYGCSAIPHRLIHRAGAFLQDLRTMTYDCVVHDKSGVTSVIDNLIKAEIEGNTLRVFNDRDESAFVSFTEVGA